MEKDKLPPVSPSKDTQEGGYLEKEKASSG